MSNDSLVAKACGMLPKWPTGPSSDPQTPTSNSKPGLDSRSSGAGHYRRLGGFVLLILQAITGGSGFKRPGSSSNDPKRNAKSQAKRLSSRSTSNAEPVSFDTYEDQQIGGNDLP
ncbi:hypothetical protein BASA81_007903 [Batrachochytrium salamandrivorans]|nr:hypothetical protein BASA81_007903 [Batrachochytrium salamandrivorans]